MGPEPRDWRSDGLLDRKLASQTQPQCHPVEAFVIVKRRSVLGPVDRTSQMLLLTGQEALPVFAHRVWTRAGIVADASPSGDAPDGLLEEQRDARFDGHTYQQRSIVFQRAP